MDYFETAEVKNLEIKSACADFRILEASDDKISVLAERVEDGLYFCKNANGTLQIQMMNTNVIGTIKLECGLGTIKLETK